MPHSHRAGPIPSCPHFRRGQRTSAYRATGGIWMNSLQTHASFCPQLAGFSPATQGPCAGRAFGVPACKRNTQHWSWHWTRGSVCPGSLCSPNSWAREVPQAPQTLGLVLPILPTPGRLRSRSTAYVGSPGTLVQQLTRQEKVPHQLACRKQHRQQTPAHPTRIAWHRCAQVSDNGSPDTAASWKGAQRAALPPDASSITDILEQSSSRSQRQHCPLPSAAGKTPFVTVAGKAVSPAGCPGHGGEQANFSGPKTQRRMWIGELCPHVSQGKRSRLEGGGLSQVVTSLSAVKGN